jgi:protein subunit release factor A
VENVPIDVEKKILGDFFTNSSGHTGMAVNRSDSAVRQLSSLKTLPPGRRRTKQLKEG